MIQDNTSERSKQTRELQRMEYQGETMDDESQ